LDYSLFRKWLPRMAPSVLPHFRHFLADHAFSARCPARSFERFARFIQGSKPMIQPAGPMGLSAG